MSNGPSPNVMRASSSAHKMVSMLLQAAIVKEQKEKDHELSLPDAIFITAHGAISALSLVAMMVAKKPIVTAEEVEENGDELSIGLITPDTFLFAALMVTKMLQGVGKNGNTATEFGPSITLEALELFEKATGYKVDAFLEPGMVEAARDLQTGSEVPLSDFMKKLNESQGKPLS